MELKFKIGNPFKVIAVFIAILLAGGLLFWGSAAFKKEDVAAPIAQLKQVTGFEPYYFTSGLPEGFSAVSNSFKYSNEVLIFKIENKSKNQNITITQQKAPPEIANRDFPNAEEVKGVDGKAYIQYDGTRVMGGLITTKHGNNQTFIIINSTDPLSKQTLEDLLRSLRAIS